jgi:hypothetical protein
MSWNVSSDEYYCREHVSGARTLVLQTDDAGVKPPP